MSHIQLRIMSIALFGRTCDYDGRHLNWEGMKGLQLVTHHEKRSVIGRRRFTWTTPAIRDAFKSAKFTVLEDDSIHVCGLRSMASVDQLAACLKGVTGMHWDLTVSLINGVAVQQIDLPLCAQRIGIGIPVSDRLFLEKVCRYIRKTARHTMDPHYDPQIQRDRIIIKVKDEWRRTTGTLVFCSTGSVLLFGFKDVDVMKASLEKLYDVLTRKATIL